MQPLEVKLKVFKEDYPNHLDLFEKETGIVLDVKDIHTFAKFDCWLKRRMSDAIKATVAVERIFMMLTKMYYKDLINFDGGIYIDPKNQNIYILSDGSNDGKLFYVDPFKSSGLVTKHLETNPSACKMIYKALDKVKLMKEEYEYNEFIRKYS